MKKIFVTGGTGFFGKSLLSMVKQGFFSDYNFTLLSRDPQKFLRDNPEFSEMKQLSFLQGEIRSFTFPEEHFDFILHAATPVTDKQPAAELRSIIIDGTKRMLTFARVCDAERFLLISSGAVYGTQPVEIERISEDSPCHPTTDYGIAKLEAEQLCMTSEIFCTVARCFSFTGPYLPKNAQFAMGNFIAEALKGKTIVIRGDGCSIRSYLYADDLTRWLLTILERGKRNRVYNVGSDCSISIADLAELIRHVLQSQSSIEIRGCCQSKTDNQSNRCYVPEISRIRHELRVEIEVDLQKAICLSAHPIQV